MKTLALRDLVHLASCGALLPCAWFVPERLWPKLSRLLGEAHFRLLGRRRPGSRAHLAQTLGVDASRLEATFHQHNHWELLELLREYAPWGWKPRIELSGKEHVDSALADGRGAILWFASFVHADLVLKKGVFEAGHAVSHLSSPAHGFSDTRFGRAVLNPIKTRVEARYLKERCVMEPPSRAFRTLVSRLGANEVVSIAAIHSGKRYAERCFLGGRLRLAKGAPNLALRTGAALLPVFVAPAEKGYMVRIERRIVVTCSDRKEAEDEMVDEYLPILERHVRAHPALWRGWFDPPSHWRLAPDVA